MGVITTRDDSRIPEGIEVPVLKSGRVSYRAWYCPSGLGHLTLSEGLDFLSIVAAPQGKIPEIIRWTEGKDSHLVKEFFYGGVDLVAHDCVHLLLGRGLLTKDEAFVIGFTMGSTNKLETLNKDIFAYIAKHYYPNAYRMDDEARHVFMDAAKLGHIYRCQPLDSFNYRDYLDHDLAGMRQEFGLPMGLIESYYRDIEQRRYPEDPASSRLDATGVPYQTWYFTGEDGEMPLYLGATKAEELLNSSDQHYDCRIASLDAFRDSVFEKHRDYLSSQKEVAKECFEEIRRICGEDHPEVLRDMETRPWDQYFGQSIENLRAVSSRLLCEVTRGEWEEPGPGVEARSYVHAILQFGDSAEERAFCRGFYDGSGNDKSSYAAELKLDILEESGVSLDGPYSDSMRRAYHDGVHMAFISDCQPLKECDWDSLKTQSLVEARQALNLTTSIFESYQNEISGTH